MRFDIQVINEVPIDFSPQRPLYFVSDLHLGDGSPADDFAEGCHLRAFEWFLEHEVEADGGELILLGDVFELWQCNLTHIRRHYGTFADRLFNYRLVRGNHDAALRTPSEWHWPAGTAPIILAEHGHRADLWNSRLGFIGRAVTVVAGILERLGWRDIDQTTWRWKHLPTPVSHPDRFPDDHYADYARRRSRETGARIVILGHTHRPCLRQLPAKHSLSRPSERSGGPGAAFGGRGEAGEVESDGVTIYANCGAWVRKDLPGSFIRLADRTISLAVVLS